MSVPSLRASDKAQETSNRSRMRVFNEGTVSPHELSRKKMVGNGGRERVSRSASMDVHREFRVQKR